MTNQPPKMSKWIFVVADLLLLAVCSWALLQFLNSRSPYAWMAAVMAVAGWIYGAWLCVMPWVEEFRAETKFLESKKLNDSIAQIQRIEEIAARIQAATGSWQSAQDSAARTATTAKEVHERIKSDMKDFMEFSDRVNSEEKKHLQLEIDKLRRAEGDWLQVSARMLDHTFALTQAAHRSGQAGLVNQLTNFQNACRDSARRMGLIPFHPAPGDPFDARAHQLEDAKQEVAGDAVISEVLATGYTFQGQLLRRSLVRVGAPQSASKDQAPTQSTEPAPEIEETTTAESAPEPPSEETEETVIEPETKAEAVVEEPVIANEVTPKPEPTQVPAKPEPVDARSEPTAEPAAQEGQEEFISISELETSAEEEQPKRGRRRKPDPQVSLPF